jgi:UDP-N-acetylglucosamine 3-dehydrogenase
MKKLRAGLIGLGMMGRHHARILNSLDGVELVAIADPAGDVHGVSGQAKVYSDVEELISHGIDYCMVAVPTIYHEETGLALASAGVHTLIEKPLAQDYQSAKNLAVKFEEKGLVGAVGHIERYNPALQEARRRIAKGELGRIFQVTTRRQNGFPARIADVGVIKDLATHDIDLTSWVTGQEYVWVEARTAHRAGREHEDLVSAVGQLGDGTVTNHLVNWLSPFKERVTVITGELGAFVCDTLTADLTFYANGTQVEPWDEVANFRGVSEGDVIRYSIAKPEPLRVEHENFRDAVLGKTADIVTMRQGLNTVRVAEMMINSANR